METLLKYFPDLTPEQQQTFQAMERLYREWNEKINLISRKDFGNFYERHVLHSLAIAKVVQFPSGSKILDVGTGGGFPGIPLAVMFPSCSFHLVDSIGKKIAVVKDVTAKLELANVTAEQCRVEQHHADYDFIVSRAVADLPLFIRFTGHLINNSRMASQSTEVYYLKGGDISGELTGIRCKYDTFDISSFFSEEFFITKKVVHLYDF